jgi:hypothetical protein
LRSNQPFTWKRGALHGEDQERIGERRGNVDIGSECRSKKMVQLYGLESSCLMEAGKSQKQLAHGNFLYFYTTIPMTRKSSQSFLNQIYIHPNM